MHDPHITAITHGTITHAGRMERCPRAVNWPGYKIYYSIAGHRLLIVKDEFVLAMASISLTQRTSHVLYLASSSKDLGILLILMTT